MAHELDIEEVHRRYLAMLRGCALRILGNAAAAQDVAQDSFVKLLEQRRRGLREENTAAFLYRVATNLALNRLRDAKRRHELEVQNPPAAAMDDLADRLSLRRIIGLVGTDVATVAVYYYVEGLEQEEIAELLGMERRTVGRRLERFRADAQRLLGARGEGKKP